MKKIVFSFVVGLAVLGLTRMANADAAPVPVDLVKLYVDAAPNAYGSPDYAPWLANAYATASNGTFVNMASSANSANVGTTNFEIQDEVVYSFGDLGKRLHWIYWIPNTTVTNLTGNFEISLKNYWGTDPEYDFYNSYYGSTWLQPTKWIDYNGGVIGTSGMAWTGAYGVNTQAALDADLAAWGSVDESWVLSARYGDETYSITSTRQATSAVPEPASMLLLGSGLVGAFLRKRFA